MESVLPKLLVDSILFTPTVQALSCSNSSLYLGGAGERGLDVAGKFVIFTVIGVYFEQAALRSLAYKWKGKSADELVASTEFFRDIYTGHFEKVTRVAMILPLTGEQYAQKVAENCVGHWKANGGYTKAEVAAIYKFKEVFKQKMLPHGSSVFFIHSASGSLQIGFSGMDASVPEAGAKVIDSRALSEAVLESIIGVNGVSPVTKRSLASRLWKFMNRTPKMATAV